jgi:serine/threonine-protein kinase
MVGRTLGPYHIVERIGAGGMGEVYRAHDARLERDVAIKVLPPAGVDDAGARARLVREARTASKLNHPHICTIHEVGEAEGHVYIAMELIEGEPLSETLTRGALPSVDVVRFGVQLADALGHAHERGVVHRDVKSANVIVTPDGRLKVLDFGIAKRASRDSVSETMTHASATGLGTVAGTVAYMAPEVLRGEPADARSDIWSIGVVLYEMATGSRPFSGQTMFEVSSAILSQPLPPLPGDVAAPLGAVIERCLIKEPAHRFQSGPEVRAALEAIQSGTAPAVASWRRASGAGKWVSRAGAVACLLLVIAGALAWFDVGGVRQRLFRTGSAARIQSLAVLPLANLSGDPGQDYLADGITEGLITDLASTGSFRRVIARGSVMRYKGSDQPLPAIARELRVDALMTGAVVRAGDRIRVTTQLIDGATEDQIWANRYDRLVRDMPALHNEILRNMLERIDVTVTSGATRIGSARRIDPDSYDAYLRGMFHIQKLTPEGYRLGREYLERGLRTDPDSALLNAGLGLAILAPAHMGLVHPRSALETGSPFTLKAVQLDDSLAQAHLQLGIMKLLLEWDWAAAERALRRTLELDANNPATYEAYADFLMLQGRRREANEALARCLELDPLNPRYHTGVGGRMLRLGRIDEGLALLQKAVQSEPGMALVHQYLWRAYDLKGAQDLALAEAKTFFTVFGHQPVADALSRGESAGGHRTAMRLGAEALEARYRQNWLPPTHIAALYEQSGDADRALSWLERGYEDHDSWLTYLKDDPRWVRLRHSRRYKALLQKLNIPETP